MNERIVQVPHRESHSMAGGETNSTTGGSDAPLPDAVLPPTSCMQERNTLAIR